MEAPGRTVIFYTLAPSEGGRGRQFRGDCGNHTACLSTLCLLGRGISLLRASVSPSVKWENSSTSLMGPWWGQIFKTVPGVESASSSSWSNGPSRQLVSPRRENLESKQFLSRVSSGCSRTQPSALSPGLQPFGVGEVPPQI